jgi:hypothetical protein
LERGFRGGTSKWWRWCSVLLLETRKSLGVPIVLVLCGDARTNLRVLCRASIDGGAWKLVPLLVYKRGGRSLSDGQYQEQAEGAYHAFFSLCLIRPRGTRPTRSRFQRHVRQLFVAFTVDRPNATMSIEECLRQTMNVSPMPQMAYGILPTVRLHTPHKSSFSPPHAAKDPPSH